MSKYYLILETTCKEQKGFVTETAFVKSINNYTDSTNGASFWTSKFKKDALLFDSKEALNNAVKKHYQYIQGINRMWNVKTDEYVWRSYNYNKLDLSYRVKIGIDA